MTESLNLPVLPLDDAVVLPGMVVPVDLSDGEVRAAVDAARAGAAGQAKRNRNTSTSCSKAWTSPCGAPSSACRGG